MEIAPAATHEVQTVGAQPAGGNGSSKAKGPTFEYVLGSVSGRKAGTAERPANEDGRESTEPGSASDGGSDGEMADLLAGTLVVLASAPIATPVATEGASARDSGETAKVEASGAVTAAAATGASSQVQAASGQLAAETDGMPATAQPGNAAQATVSKGTGAAKAQATGAAADESQMVAGSPSPAKRVSLFGAALETAEATQQAGASAIAILGETTPAGQGTQPSQPLPGPLAGDVTVQSGSTKPASAPKVDAAAAEGAAQTGDTTTQPFSGQALDGAKAGSFQNSGTGQQQQAGSDRGGSTGSSSAVAMSQAAQVVGAATASQAEPAAAKPGELSTPSIIGAATVEAAGQREVGAAGSTATTSATGRPAASSVFDQVLEQASRLSVPRNTRMRVQLTPPSLGGVDLRLSMKDGVLSLGITTELGKTRDLIQAALPELRQALEQRGLEIGQLSLSTGSGQGAFGGWLGNSMGSFGPGNQWVGSGRHTVLGSQAASGSEADVAEQPGQRAGGDDGGSPHLVDYRI